MINKPKSIYIAGPMTGLPEHNFPAFNKAAKHLKKAGWQVVNPAENFGGRTDLSRETYLRADVASLVRCDAIAMLPDWELSQGAKLEYLIAQELAMPVYDAATLQPLNDVPLATALIETNLYANKQSILDEAKVITDGDRQVDYGHPRECCTRIAQMWNGILAGKLRDDTKVTAHDIPLCMIAVKLARQSHCHKRDNLIDIAGYARTAAMVVGDE